MTSLYTWSETMKNIKCEECKKQMEYLWNVSWIMYLSYPAQQDNVYVCEECKTKKTVRERWIVSPDYSYIDGYDEQITLHV